jgi:hypothetical protein
MKKAIYLSFLLTFLSIYVSNAANANENVTNISCESENVIKQEVALDIKQAISLDINEGAVLDNIQKENLNVAQKDVWVVTEIRGYKESYFCYGPYQLYYSVKQAALDGCLSVLVILEQSCVLI